MRRAALYLTLVSLAVVSCSGGDAAAGPTGPAVPTGRAALTLASRAETFKENISIPILIFAFVPCADGGAGELVLATGPLHILIHLTVNGNRFVLKTHFQPQGLTGVGLSTGAKYQGTGVTQETFGGSFVNGQFRDTSVNNFRFIGQGPGNNLLIHQNFHVTINANGEITVIHDNSSFVCK